MPLFKLSKSARQLLASCIEIGFEGADGSVNDEEIIGTILDELRESEATETVVHIAPTPTYEREVRREAIHQAHGVSLAALDDNPAAGKNNTEAYG